MSLPSAASDASGSLEVKENGPRRTSLIMLASGPWSWAMCLTAYADKGGTSRWSLAVGGHDALVSRGPDAAMVTHMCRHAPSEALHCGVHVQSLCPRLKTARPAAACGSAKMISPVGEMTTLLPVVALSSG